MKITKRTLPQQKKIALVAHDNCKQDLIEWCVNHKKILKNHNLFGTGTTAGMLQQYSELKIYSLLSGPMGGDQQLGAMIATKKIDMMVFFWDPMNAVPHDPDVKALLRISTVWNIPVAMNRATAEFLINSPSFNESVDISVPDYDAYVAERLD